MRYLALLVSLTFVCAPARSQDWAKKALEKSRRHGEWVKFPSSAGEISAFVVYPETKGKAPAVVLIHEIFGLTDWARDMADRLAADGVIVIAPDLLSGKGPFSGIDDARKAVGELSPQTADAILDASADYVKKLPSANGKLGVIGFCWGGGQSFRFATRRPDLSASFVFYGTPPEDPTAAKAPVFGFYGGNDARVTSTVEDTKKTMAEASKKYEAVVYDGAGHGFMRGGEDPAGTQGDRAARKKALKRLATLLEKDLGAR